MPSDHRTSQLSRTLQAVIALGSDVAGVVAAVGAEVTRVKVGDQVFARLVVTL